MFAKNVVVSPYVECKQQTNAFRWEINYKMEMVKESKLCWNYSV